MRATVSFLIIAALAGCGGGGQTPVINKSPYRVVPDDTRVRAGDSIYKIAWDFGLDYRDIARLNGIDAPFNLRGGQKLRLPAREVKKPPPPTVEAVEVTDATVTPSPSSTPTPSLSPTPSPSPSSTPSPSPSPSPTTVTATTTGDWNWPADGELVGKFSRNKGVNGIQIAGAEGSAVRSTAAGEVVYAGDGLRGYGNLIIVKHSPSYLSAYAHNRKILVAEGDAIKSGQQIAQMGSSGAERTMLHFEIRKDGEPVDPLGFLN